MTKRVPWLVSWATLIVTPTPNPLSTHQSTSISLFDCHCPNPTSKLRICSSNRREFLCVTAKEVRQTAHGFLVFFTHWRAVLYTLADVPPATTAGELNCLLQLETSKAASTAKGELNCPSWRLQRQLRPQTYHRVPQCHAC